MLIKSETNNAIVTTLCNVRPHPNADRLKLATVLGNQVIVGLDAKEGDEVIYFDSNLRLSHNFLHYNNLYSNPELNADQTKKGYFGSNGRVRAQRFRGEISNGFISEPPMLTMVPGVDENSFPVGTEFTHINGVEICSKYVVPKKYDRQEVNKKLRVKKPESDMFWKHWDTKQLYREFHRIGEGLLYVEEKIHGTSARTGKVLCNTGKKWYQFWKPKQDWRVISGTRRVDNIGFHLHNTRKEIEEKLAPHLRCGEQVYYEIAGYSDTKEIQPGFKYGCRPGEYKVFLYRVTITTPDGFCVDMDRDYVYNRAEELGLLKPFLLDVVYYNGLFNVVDYLAQYAEGQSMIDPGTLREGVVVWFKNVYGKWDCLKHKNPEFLLQEDKDREKEIGDVEDSL